MLITKGFAEEYQVWTLEDLDGNADAIAAYDATDANPGNGMVDIFGCPEDWTLTTSLTRCSQAAVTRTFSR